MDDLLQHSSIGEVVSVIRFVILGIATGAAASFALERHAPFQRLTSKQKLGVVSLVVFGVPQASILVEAVLTRRLPIGYGMVIEAIQAGLIAFVASQVTHKKDKMF